MLIIIDSCTVLETELTQPLRERKKPNFNVSCKLEDEITGRKDLWKD